MSPWLARCISSKKNKRPSEPADVTDRKAAGEWRDALPRVQDEQKLAPNKSGFNQLTHKIFESNDPNRALPSVYHRGESDARSAKPAHYSISIFVFGRSNNSAHVLPRWVR